jgi:DNA helicase II / ATP-dependent DNA helicase PcrA
MDDLKKELNASQLAAVNATDGPLLVIAGAGSGKTRVIEYRVLNLVQSGIDPSSILLLTFTRRAAHEMLSRASRHDHRCKDVDGGTFHSFAYGRLKRYAATLGFTNTFSVLDEGDAADAVWKCAYTLKLFEGEKRFPKKDTLRAIISMCVNKNKHVEEIVEKEYPHFRDYVADIERLRKLYAKYKIAKNYVDYDDLLVYLKILLENDGIRKRICRKYRYLMVDEYQDTNAMQGDITCLLAREHSNVMAVGDDAQSIYGFRGASHENIMAFPGKFPGCKIIVLEENYRSTQGILDVANASLENMTNKYSKCLVSAKEEKGARPSMMLFKDAYEEAEWIAGRIRELEDEGIGLAAQAVLFRSAYVSIPLQAELSRLNIPYQVYGGLKFYETAHVKDVMAHLRIIANLKDELSWSRVLMLIDGIGPKRAQGLTDEIMACASFNDVVEKVFYKYKAAHVYSKGLMKLASALRGAYDKTCAPGSQFEIVIDYYDAILKSKFDDWHIRINDLAALKQVSSRYRHLEDILADLAIESPERGVAAVAPEAPHNEDTLTLSTIHSAKGLEWDTVFLMGLVEGVLPISFALDSEEEIEEEHRLFYVGITRAKHRLYLSLHHEGTRGGITQFNKISRFLDNANILSKVDQAEGEAMEDAFEDLSASDGDIKPVYDKDALYRRVIDYFD